jgi:cytochrome c-type biogenesis protein CcmH
MTVGRSGGRAVYDRREFLAVGIGIVLTARPPVRQSPQDTTSAPSGRLYDPSWVTSVQPVAAGDNDQAIQAIEKRLKCTCGCGLDIYTCRTTDFTCPVSPKLHARVLALAESGNTPQQIIGEFVREHGIEILMAPPRSGFNLLGYYTPYVLIAAAAVALLYAMSRWVRRGASAPATVAAATAGASAAELEGLREALRRTEA